MTWAKAQYVGLLACRIGVLATAGGLMFGGHHPPASAQEQRQQQVYIPVLSNEDVGQDKDIAAINKHLEETDRRVDRQWGIGNQNASDISGLKGEERVFGAVITLLAGSGLILQVRNKKAA